MPNRGIFAAHALERELDELGEMDWHSSLTEVEGEGGNKWDFRAWRELSSSIPQPAVDAAMILLAHMPGGGARVEYAALDEAGTRFRLDVSSQGPLDEPFARLLFTAQQVGGMLIEFEKIAIAAAESREEL